MSDRVTVLKNRMELLKQAYPHAPTADKQEIKQEYDLLCRQLRSEETPFKGRAEGQTQAQAPAAPKVPVAKVEPEFESFALPPLPSRPEKSEIEAKEKALEAVPLPEEVARARWEVQQAEGNRKMRVLQEKLAKERRETAIKRVAITANCRTLDMQCPVCFMKVPKPGLVEIVTDGLPWCSGCQKTYAKKLYSALERFHAEFPDLRNCDFAQALAELESWTGWQVLDKPKRRK